MLRIIQWGTGYAGKRTAKAIHKAADLELVGCYVTSAEKAGRDVGDICETAPMGVRATTDKEAIFATPADCCLYMTIGEYGLDGPVDDICRLLASGKNVISTATTVLTYPLAAGQVVFDRIAAACRAGGTTFHGAGIHPGWATTLLPLIMTGAMGRIDLIHVQEIVDYGNYPTVASMFELMKYGEAPNPVPPRPVPLTHLGAFGAPLRMIADALGVTLDADVIYQLEVAVAKESYDIPAGRIEKGTVSGKRFSFTGTVDGKPRIIMENVNRANDPGPAHWPQGHGWYTTIQGEPTMKLSAEVAINGEDHTDSGTLAAAMVVMNLIRPVCAAAPGIRTYLDLPLIIGRGTMTGTGINA